MPLRIQRFKPGDLVAVVRGGLRHGPAEVLEVFLEPHTPGYEHCAGNSARYRVAGYDGDLYDWMLESSSPG